MGTQLQSGLDDVRQGWVEAAAREVSEADAARLLSWMVDTPSPTGSEAELARMVVEQLGSAGLDGRLQPIGPGQANALGLLRGCGEGPALMLYGHLDTHLSGDPLLDAPAADGPLPPMSRPQARREGDLVLGLGAGNPKGYAAAAILAATAIARAGVPLRGDLMLGLCAGGMPAQAPAGSALPNVGLGVGASYMLQSGFRPDFAIIGKPGHAIAWEEVGLLWCRLRVGGALGYSGTRHVLEYDNSIAAAARLIGELEEWFEEYAREETSGYVAPQAMIGAIAGGWPEKPAFSPAWTDLFLDVRVSPRSNPNAVRRKLEAAVDRIAARHGLRVEVEALAAIPGTATDPEAWIVGSCERAFEALEGRPPEPIRATSGATDAAILRLWGIPTARWGMASGVREERATLAMDLDSVELPNLVRFARGLIHAVVDTCTRRSDELP